MTTESNNPQTTKQPIKKSSYWMIYTSLLIAAVVLLGDGLAISHLNKWTAKVGIALIFTVFFMLVCKNQTKAIIASLIIWVAVIATFVI
ncbi:MAG: hypothetical protein ABIJ12_04610 [bacterium]